MQSPFPKSASSPGRGDVHLTLLPPATPAFSTLSYTYPLKLLPSNPHKLAPTLEAAFQVEATDGNSASDRIDARSSSLSSVPLLFILTYGGGLLAGDHVDLTIRLDPYTRLTIATQGSTKVYKNAISNAVQGYQTNVNTSPFNLESIKTPKSRAFAEFDPNTISKQDLHVFIGTDAGLWIGPDPIQPFKASRYAQKQIFEVEIGGSIGLVDWVTEGRRARGESWQMDGWRGRNEIWAIVHEGQGVHSEKKGHKRKILMIRDSVILQPDSTTGILPSLSSQVGVIGTILLYGPLFTSLSTFFLSEFAALPRIGGRSWDPVLSKAEESAAEANLTAQARWRKLRHETEQIDGLLWTAARVRAGVTVVKFAAREVEGARTWLRAMLKEEGGVAESFGPGGIMFVR